MQHDRPPHPPAKLEPRTACAFRTSSAWCNRSPSPRQGKASSKSIPQVTEDQAEGGVVSDWHKFNDQFRETFWERQERQRKARNKARAAQAPETPPPPKDIQG